MAIKDFFRSSQVIASSSLDSMNRDIESAEYIAPFVEDQERLLPHVDFGDPANFAKYGSAQEYYDQSIKHIYGEYPYDGSLKERYEWRNSATLLDLYIFDNRYPKTTGYVIFSSGSVAGWGANTGSVTNGYGSPAVSDYEYINFTGGPTSPYGSNLGTSSLSDVFGSKANVWDTTVTGSGTRESNLKLDLDAGVTVEFWLKTGSLAATLTEKQVVFDLWNNQTASSTEYGRLRIEIDGKAGTTRAAAPFRVTLLSGSDPTTGPRGLSTSSLDIGSNLDLNSFSDWGHYAFSFINNGDNITTKLYVNGDLSETITTGSSLNEIINPLQANIGALITGTFAPGIDANAAASPNLGWGKLSGSLDEFRFWKVKRDSEQIGRYWFTNNVGGGTNTDLANTTLGVYYKFNEGIVGDTSVDNIVLDYSGRATNGTWTGYSSTSRDTGSAIVSASAGIEDLDPIMRPQHSSVVNLDAELELSGTVWDYENNSSLYYTMPAWIIEEDEGNGGESGDLKRLTQIMSTYFDNLQLQIGELSKLNMAYYPSSSAQGELFKPYIYASRAVRSHGLEAPELFSNTSIFEYYRNRNEDKEYAEDLQTIKSFIYNNIYNNLSSIYKSKGTEKSFRNLISCFGIDEDLIRLNAYADNQTYKFETKRRASSYKTKAVDFNHIDRFVSTVHQYADTSNANSVSYISGSATDSKTYEDRFPVTLEAEVVFPLKLGIDSKNQWAQEFAYTTASLFGMHTAITSASMGGTETDLTWKTPDTANFQVFAVRDNIGSNDAYFMLSASDGGMILGDQDLDNGITSSYFKDVYSDSKWNFAVRIKPYGYPQAFVSGAVDNGYNVEFYGVNYVADRKINEFEVVKTVTVAAAEAFLTASKRAYVGAHLTNFTGTVVHSSDAKVTSLRYWFDYVDNTTIQNHAIDPSSFGPLNPSRDSFLLETDLANVQVPQIESLALYWDFDTVTGSNASGQFTVQDVSSGSVANTGSYNWLGGIVKYQHTGRGFSFPVSSTASVENQYLYAGRQQLPEVVQGDDNIRVFSQAETEIFTKETRPTKTYYAFEKSMYQVISDEIINYFASIAEFNNLIGEPVNRYRPEYKGLKYLRQFFFERVRNVPDLDKFIDYYKWLDATLETMLMQLVPASAQVSDGIDNIVESHILERSKYQSKFPTLEFNTPTPETGALGINHLLYNWKTGHRPLTGKQTANCFYWKERAERNTDPLNKTATGTAPAGVTSGRNHILSASYRVLERTYTTPYRYSVVKNKTIHGGINYSENKRQHFYRGLTFPHGAKDSSLIPVNVLVTFNADVHVLKSCDEEASVETVLPQRSGQHAERPIDKSKYAFGTHTGRVTMASGTFDGVKGEIALPFNVLTASLPTELVPVGRLSGSGYHQEIQHRFLSGAQLVNLHNDGYGSRNEVPMQGPFPEKYVGGHQGRHVRLNYSSSTRVAGDRQATINGLDGMYSRPEAYRILLGGGPPKPWGAFGNGALGITGPDYGGPYPDQTRYRAWWFREETAKRPVNIRNILQTTASVDTVLSGVLQHGPIGNYEKTYQVVQTSGRSTNNSWFNDNGATLPPKYINNLANPTSHAHGVTTGSTHGQSGSIRMPTTTNVHTLIAVRSEMTGSSAYWAPSVGAKFLVARGNGFIPQASSSLDRAGATQPWGSEQNHNAGRISNLYLPKATVATSASAGAITVFELPDRTKQDAVIVERFSAPGGPEINSLGFLDIMAAEKSVYNALPYRNLMVRGSGSGEPGEVIDLGSSRYVTRNATMHVEDHTGRLRGLQTLLSLHAGWGGIDGTYGVITDKGHTTGLQGLYVETASYHKVNRNRAIKIQADGTTGSVYDNWFVQHPIPQNDFQYAWISGSILPNTATSVVGAANQGGIGHAPKSGLVAQSGTTKPAGFANGLVPAITFVSGSQPDYSASVTVNSAETSDEKISVDFVGLNTLIYDPMSGSAFNILGTGSYLLGSARILRQNVNPLYEHSDPRIYRNLAFATLGGAALSDPEVEEGWLAFNALMLHRNGPYGYPSWKQIRGGEHSLVRQMNKANTISIINPLTERSYARQQAGGYMGYKWAPQGLATIEDIYGEPAPIWSIGPTYRPWITASAMAYHEPAVNISKPMVFEADLNSPGLSVTASPTLQPVSWKATYANQKQYFINSKLNENLRIDAIGGHTAGDILMDAFANDQLNSTLNTLKYSERVYPKKTNIYRQYITQRQTYNCAWWRSTRLNRNLEQNVNMSEAIPYEAPNDITASGVTSQGFSMATSSIWVLDARVDIAKLAAGDDMGGIVTDSTLGRPRVYMAGRRKGANINQGFTPAAVGYFPSCGGGEGELQNSLNTVHSGHVNYRGPSEFNYPGSSSSGISTQNSKRWHITASATYNRRHIMVTGSSTLAWSSAYGPCGSGNLGVSGAPPGSIGAKGKMPKFIVPFAGDAPWDAANISGKEPFYDSYEKYLGAMRVQGRDYSILPEYRMSERIEDYLINGLNPVDDPALFSLTGALANTTSSTESDFYKVYSHTDFMQHFGVVQTSADSKLNAAPATISLSCKGLLKLLPYDGFYPASRTVQLARLFSQSYGTNVTLTGSTHLSPVSPMDNAAGSMWRCFLTPFFAPGLLFNTIKSGIAVDWPIFTERSPSASIEGLSLSGDTGVPEYKHRSYMIGEPSFDMRIPFEALIEPEAHIANIDIYDMEVHPSAAFSASNDAGETTYNREPEGAPHARWTGQGDNRYRLAMHNFLAETPEFFLDQGQFTTFISEPRSRWGTPDPNTSYKMRVKLKKSYTNYQFSSSYHGKGVSADGKELENKIGHAYPQIVSGTETIVMYSRPSAFGPEVGGGPPSYRPGAVTYLESRWNRGFHGDSRTGYNPAFTPAYYDGEAWADLEYNPGLYPGEATLPDLNTLLSRITSSYLRFAGPCSGASSNTTRGIAMQNVAGNWLVTKQDVSKMHWLHGLGGPYKSGGPGTGAGAIHALVVPTPGPMSGAYECNTNSNQVSSSVSLFGTTKGLQDILKYEGVDMGTSEDQWVVQTKFETPILNFIDMSASGPTATPATGMTFLSENFSNSEFSGGLHTRPIGMWHQYGRLPKHDEGIFLEITDVPPTQKFLFPEATRTPISHQFGVDSEKPATALLRVLRGSTTLSNWENKYFAVESTDGTAWLYYFVDGGTSAGSSFDADDAPAIGLTVNTTVQDSAATIATRIVSAINGSAGHNGKILARINGGNTAFVELTQSAGGKHGNITITSNLSDLDLAVSGFNSGSAEVLTGSLADLVGFRKSSEKLGKIAKTKTIREAVVAVPFKEIYGNRNFFRLQRSQIKYLLGTGNGSREPGEQNMVAPGQSIVDMVQAMQRYVFPPSMDFINYPDDVTPFAMYIFEFSHTLNQQDLADIWQNLPPRIGRAFDENLPDKLTTDETVQTHTVAHPIQAGELLDSVDEHLQWMVFKVKQKAATNYYRKSVQQNRATASPIPSLSPSTTFGSVTGVTLSFASPTTSGPMMGAGLNVTAPTTMLALSKTDIFTQTYNWPYDFFSLVELAKIDDVITFAPVIPQPPLATVTGDTTNVRPGNLSAVYNHTHTYTIDANGNGTTNLVTVSTPLGIDAHSHQIVNFTLSEHTDAYGYGPHNHDILGSSGGTGGGTATGPGTRGPGSPGGGGSGGGTATGPGTTGPGSPGGGGTGTGTGMQVTTTGQGGAGGGTGGTGGTGATGLPTQGTPPGGGTPGGGGGYGPGGGGGYGGGGGGGGYGPK